MQTVNVREAASKITEIEQMPEGKIFLEYLKSRNRMRKADTSLNRLYYSMHAKGFRIKRESLDTIADRLQSLRIGAVSVRKNDTELVWEVHVGKLAKELRGGVCLEKRRFKGRVQREHMHNLHDRSNDLHTGTIIIRNENGAEIEVSDSTSSDEIQRLAEILGIKKRGNHV